MCIRDRSKIMLNDQLIEQVYAFNYLGCSFSYRGSDDPVSYTHLDVYKRQLLVLVIVLVTSTV